MIVNSAFLTAHAPGDATEFVVLAAATAVTAIVGWRVVGGGYGLLSAALGVLAFVIVGNTAIPLAAAMVACGLGPYARRSGVSLTRPSSHFATELCICLGAMFLYMVGRYAVERGGAGAFGNADAIVETERALGLYVEPRLQEFALRYETLTRSINWVYSFAFLAIVTAALLWLWVVDARHYRILRDSIGISVLLAIPTIALVPVAPPRLLADAGVIDTIAVFGREHAFANQYAALPSLHVGWMAATGVVVGRSIGGRKGLALALTMGPLMLLTVMVTGNHFWIDGAVGAAYAVGPVLVLVHGRAGAARARAAAQRVSDELVRAADLTWAVLTEKKRALFSSLALGGLLFYLVAAQQVNPGFTDFWGYLAVQVFVFMVLLVGAEVVFAKEGGLSWWTHVIAVACAYADVLGTDGNLYAQIDEYDKLTHFAGVAALTAGLYDGLRALYRRGTISWAATDRLMFAIAVGVAIGIGWEVYELLGDKVFNTTRVNSRWDTANDIVSDSAGAIILACLLWWGEVRGPDWTRRSQREIVAFDEGPAADG